MSVKTGLIDFIMSDVFEKCTKEPDHWKWGCFENERGKMLRYGSLAEHNTPHANIIYVEGLSEFAEKTFEVSRDFSKENCNFYVLDRMGQGYSGRLLQHQFKQHSTGFKDDITDLVQLTQEIITPENNAPVLLLGHSTGGLISLMALHDRPDVFDGTVMTAPLFGIHHPLVKGREELFAKILPDIKMLMEAYITKHKDWLPRNDPRSKLKPDDFSSHPERNAVHDHFEISYPGLRTGGPTAGWLKTACTDITRVRNTHYLQEIKKPVLIFTAGQDKLVDTAASFNIHAGLPQSDLQHFKQGKHELLMETEDIRKPILEKTFDFIKNTPFRKP